MRSGRRENVNYIWYDNNDFVIFCHYTCPCETANFGELLHFTVLQCFRHMPCVPRSYSVNVGVRSAHLQGWTVPGPTFDPCGHVSQVPNSPVFLPPLSLQATKVGINITKRLFSPFRLMVILNLHTCLSALLFFCVFILNNTVLSSHN